MNQQILFGTVLIVFLNAFNSAFGQETVNPSTANKHEVLTPEASTLTNQLNDSEKESEGMLYSVFGQLDKTHTSISSGLEETVVSIDRFFADDKVFEQANKSYLRIALDMVTKEYEGTGFKGDLKLKVDLPRLKKRLKLLIETDSQRDSQDNLSPQATDVVQERDFFISLERQVSQSKQWDVRPALGFKARSGRLDFFGRIRSYRYIPLDNWLLRASNNLNWFESRGFGANGALEFDRPVTKNLLFQVTSSLNWLEEEKFRRFNQGVSFYQNIDARRSLAYQIAGFADDETDWLAKQYFMRVRYRQDLHKNWMFGEIIPQISFEKESDFHPKSSITFRLEMVFGKRD